MAIPGELNGIGGTTCKSCGEKLPLKVCQSAAGYYVGYWCPNCGPVSRETSYCGSHEEANEMLDFLREMANAG